MHFSSHCATAVYIEKGCFLLLTPGGTGDTPTSLAQTGAVQHHPALVAFLPGLPHDV